MLGVRPEGLRLAATGPSRPAVTIVEMLGAEAHVICHPEDGTRLVVRQGRPPRPARVRRAIAVDVDAAALHLFDRPAGARWADAVSGGARRCARAAAQGGGLAYLLVLPALVVFGVFTFYPFLRNFKLVLYQTPPVPGLPSHYVGLHQVVPT